MSIRTKENLFDKISEDLVWRKKEISQLKGFVSSESTPEYRVKMLCRSGTALLYAHWEGFVKKSGGYYLEYVALQRLSISELNSNFVTLMLKGKIDSCSTSKKYSVFGQITDLLLHQPSTQAKIPYKNGVKTESNLSSTVLKEITWCLGIEYGLFEPKEKLINQKLLGRRNHIAHGEELPVNREDFLDLADEVLGLMILFKNLLENATMTENYKKTT